MLKIGVSAEHYIVTMKKTLDVNFITHYFYPVRNFDIINARMIGLWSKCVLWGYSDLDL